MSERSEFSEAEFNQHSAYFLYAIEMTPQAKRPESQEVYVSDRIEDASIAFQKGQPMKIAYDGKRRVMNMNLVEFISVDRQFIAGMHTVRRSIGQEFNPLR